MCLITGERLTLREHFYASWFFETGWNNQLWFMGALVCIYIFFPLMKSTFDINRKTFIFFLVACSILTIGNSFLNELASIAKGLVEGHPILIKCDFFGIYNALRGIHGYSFMYFCLGDMLIDILPRIKAISPKKRTLLSLCLVVIATAFWRYGGIMRRLQKERSTISYGAATIRSLH